MQRNVKADVTKAEPAIVPHANGLRYFAMTRKGVTHGPYYANGGFIVSDGSYKDGGRTWFTARWIEVGVFVEGTKSKQKLSAVWTADGHTFYKSLTYPGVHRAYKRHGVNENDEFYLDSHYTEATFEELEARFAAFRAEVASVTGKGFVGGYHPKTSWELILSQRNAPPKKEHRVVVDGRLALLTFLD
jgi:hypothetical protein